MTMSEAAFAFVTPAKAGAHRRNVRVMGPLLCGGDVELIA